MRLFIFVLERRRAFLHIFFCVLYFLFFAGINWDSGGITSMKAIALLLISGAGISVAYIMRYVFILGIKRKQWGRSSLLFFTVFFLTGIIGYIIFHGFENALSDTIVHRQVEHPWADYIRSYVSWYSACAKYGLLFCLSERMLFWALDGFLSRYWPEHVAPPKRFMHIHPDNEVGERRNRLVGHFLNNLMSRVYSGLMSGKRMKSKQVVHLVSLVDYGQWNYLQPFHMWVPLTKEIAAVRHLLAMEEEHSIRLCVRGNIAPARIPAVLLLSIAKNMVKHGAGTTEEGDALLDIQMEGTTLCVTSENMPHDKPRWKQYRGGYGLQYIRRLLEANYGDGAIFRTGMADGRFRVYLQIDNIKRRSHG